MVDHHGVTFQMRIERLIDSEFQGTTSSSIRIAVQSATTQSDAIHFARLSLEARGQGPVPGLRVVHVSENETEARMIAKELLRQMLVASSATSSSGDLAASPTSSQNGQKNAHRAVKKVEQDLDDQIMRRIGYCGKGASGRYFVCAAI